MSDAGRRAVRRDAGKECTERAAFGGGARGKRRVAAALRQDVDHAADGVAAIERRLRPAQHFDAVDIVDQQIAELAVHGWDLAVATGQSTPLDTEVGDTALTWARTALQPQFRGSEDEGKAFGPEVDVPEDAPLYDRLAGFFGHRPI